MANWPDTVDNGINLARRRPIVAILLAAIVAIGIYFYAKRNPSVSLTKTNSVQTKGDKNQTSGTNDGTMNQTNK